MEWNIEILITYFSNLAKKVFAFHFLAEGFVWCCNKSCKNICYLVKWIHWIFFHALTWSSWVKEIRWRHISKVRFENVDVTKGKCYKVSFFWYRYLYEVLQIPLSFELQTERLFMGKYMYVLFMNFRVAGFLHFIQI